MSIHNRRSPLGIGAAPLRIGAAPIGIAVPIAIALLGGIASAQPAPQPTPQPAPQPGPPPSGDKVDAKSLMQSGLRLFEAKDYLGALAVFKSAYQRFPSAKILLNIGTTLKALNRDAEAANTYQQYLDSPDSDPAKRGEVESVITEIDKTVGKLEITVTPADAEVQVNSDDAVPAARAKRYRVAAGQFTVNARKDKFQNEAKQAQISAGEVASISLTLTALPEETKIVQVPVSSPGTGVSVESNTRSRIGVLAIAHLDIPRGGAALVGATGDITEQLQAQAALIIGPTEDTKVTLSGVYAGATFAFLSGNLHPLVAAGFPVFFQDGARFAARAAGGIEYQLNRHISIIAELGLEYVFNPAPMYHTNVFVPAIGASGRL